MVDLSIAMLVHQRVYHPQLKTELVGGGRCSGIRVSTSWAWQLSNLPAFWFRSLGLSSGIAIVS